MFEKEYFDNCYMTNMNEDDYNLNVRENEECLNEKMFNCFNPINMTSDEFLDNFMKIDYNNELFMKKPPSTIK
jgi:hypothetical protein